MNQGNNQYHRFGYQPFNQQTPPQGYERQPSEAGPPSFDESASAPAGRLRALAGSPFVMTGALIMAAVVFGGIMMLSSPSSEDIPQPIPIVQADAGALKSSPEEAGGMEIANRDTTVFDVLKNKPFDEGNGKPVENLLEPSQPDEAPMSKEDVIAKLETQGEHADVPAEISEELKAPEAMDVPAEEADTQDSAALEAAPAVPAIGEKVEASASAALPDTMHEPGASPDTIAFVRSVLDKKDGKSSSTGKASASKTSTEAQKKPEEIFPDVEPAAGVATAAAPVAPVSEEPKAKPVSAPASVSSSTKGTHYVQVVSVPSRSAAESEWSKVQKAFSSVLGSAPHRIQEANLGEKGTYYRVQVGPFDEASAKSLCGQIKAQKPGGCLVTH